MQYLRKFIKNNKGATAIEYGLIAVAAVGVMGTVGGKLKNVFTNVSNNMNVS